MAASGQKPAYSPAAREEFERLASECSPCYQCGTCTSSCPTARELESGPRGILRLVLAGDIEAVLASDDLWRCTGCGTCSDACRMEIDVAQVLRRLRHLERTYGSTIRCPERSAADIATAQLKTQRRIDSMRFGLGMIARGYVPKDKTATLGTGLHLARGKVQAVSGATPRRRPAAGDVTLPFYAGCAVPQDGKLHALIHEAAAGFGVRLQEDGEAGCCGHPGRGAVAGRHHCEGRVFTVCPACDTSLRQAQVSTVPLWDALISQARRGRVGLRAAAGSFAPYVGCLAERDQALDGLEQAAQLAGVQIRRTYPSLHNGCCGALGGTYRGATRASAALLEFAAEHRAPIVSTCALCRDNLRSAARELRKPVPVYFWPEFFRAAPPVLEDQP